MTTHHWRISYRENAASGGAETAWCVVHAPTAADAIVLFNVATKRRVGGRYFMGAEGIRLALDGEIADLSRRLVTDLDGVRR